MIGVGQDARVRTFLGEAGQTPYWISVEMDMYIYAADVCMSTYSTTETCRMDFATTEAC
jgi:hypothetical protein